MYKITDASVDVSENDSARMNIVLTHINKALADDTLTLTDLATISSLRYSDTFLDWFISKINVRNYASNGEIVEAWLKAREVYWRYCETHNHNLLDDIKDRYGYKLIVRICEGGYQFDTIESTVNTAIRNVVKYYDDIDISVNTDIDILGDDYKREILDYMEHYIGVELVNIYSVSNGIFKQVGYEIGRIKREAGLIEL